MNQARLHFPDHIQLIAAHSPRINLEPDFPCCFLLYLIGHFVEHIGPCTAFRGYQGHLDGGAGDGAATPKKNQKGDQKRNSIPC